MNLKHQHNRQTRYSHLTDFATAGFSLLEVMVAVTILGIALVVIMQLFSIGLKSALMEKEYTQAVFLAKTKMGEILADSQFAQGNAGGTFENGYQWQVSIEPFEGLEDEENAADNEIEGSITEKVSFQLFEITLVVSWGEDTNRNKKVTLKSLRLNKSESSL